MRKRTLGAVLLAGLAVSGAGAFTDSNAVDASVAGVGSGDVSGVTISDLDYTLTQVAGVDKVSAVAFTSGTALAGKDVIVRLKDATSTLVSADNIATTLTGGTCTVDVAGTRATCTWATGQANLVDVTSVEVVAYDND